MYLNSGNGRDGSTVTPIEDPDGAEIRPAMILDDGYVVGRRLVGSGDVRVFAFHDGALTDFGSFLGTSTVPYAINDARHVVGTTSSGSGGGWEAFVLDTGDGTWRQLPDLIAGGESRATGITPDGVVVGTIHDAEGRRRAAVWTLAGPDAVVAHLRRAVSGLREAGVLNRGVANALEKKLDAGAYRAFVNQAAALVRSRRLDPTIGDALIRAAESLPDL